jgi:hypothetical protein
MVRTNAAVFPVPDCDWPIRFVGLEEVMDLYRFPREIRAVHTGLRAVEEERVLGSWKAWRTPYRIFL